MTQESDQWPVWEVFVRGRRGLTHQHAGSLYAADAQMALENARDLYTRRQEGISIWVVPSNSITASSPTEDTRHERTQTSTLGRKTERAFIWI